MTFQQCCFVSSEDIVRSTYGDLERPFTSPFLTVSNLIQWGHRLERNLTWENQEPLKTNERTLVCPASVKPTPTDLDEPTDVEYPETYKVGLRSV